MRINSHIPVNVPDLAFVYQNAQAAMATLDRVATVSQKRLKAARLAFIDVVDFVAGQTKASPNAVFAWVPARIGYVCFGKNSR